MGCLQKGGLTQRWFPQMWVATNGCLQELSQPGLKFSFNNKLNLRMKYFSSNSSSLKAADSNQSENKKNWCTISKNIMYHMYVSRS